MLPDAEGFLQPVIDAAKCVQCGKCEAVCPVLHQGQPRTPLATYAAKAKDDGLRRISSSGGVFSLLARQVIARGGVVFGAAFEPETFRVIHQAARNEEELDALRGSKYVQSDLGDTFAEVRDLLRQGVEVLYSGCPCQIAGLRNFLGGESANLLTVEVICHAVPSPLAWEVFLRSQELERGGKVVAVESRRKCRWRAFETSFTIMTGENGFCECRSDLWYRTFFKELVSRRCCSDCYYRDFRSGADITLGDFWGIEDVRPGLEDQYGVSLLTCNAEKGVAVVQSLGTAVYVEPVDLQCAKKKNLTIAGSLKHSRHRDRFLSMITPGNFNETAHRFTDFPKWFLCLRALKRRILQQPDE